VAASFLPACSGLVGRRCDGGDYLSTPQQLSRRVADLLMIPSSRLADCFLVAAIVEGMVEFERRSAMQMIRLIQPWAGLDPTGMLGLWEVANEVTCRMSRPQPPPDRDDFESTAEGSGTGLGRPGPPIRID